MRFLAALWRQPLKAEYEQDLPHRGKRWRPVRLSGTENRHKGFHAQTLEIFEARRFRLRAANFGAWTGHLGQLSRK